VYIPAHFEESRVDVLHDFVRKNQFATLVTHGASGINANHIPFVLKTEPAPYGVLNGHVARANAVCQDLASGGEALVIFQGPDAYITPSWYETKKQTGTVVPTWNYIVVHAYGRPKLIEDKDWLLSHLTELTNKNESTLDSPWAVSDAPEEFVAKLMGAIIGIEMVVTRFLGKWKVSQNRSAADMSGVVDGLRTSNTAGAKEMAEVIGDLLTKKT
jgi:transcriptional regulator